MSKLIVELTPEQLRHLKFTRDVGIDRGAMDYGTADDKVTMAEVDAALEAAQPGRVLTEEEACNAIKLLELAADGFFGGSVSRMAYEITAKLKEQTGAGEAPSEAQGGGE